MKIWIDVSAPAHVLVFRPLIKLLREQGIKTQSIRSDRETAAGRIAVYTDMTKGVAGMVELKCESAPVAGSTAVSAGVLLPAGLRAAHRRALRTDRPPRAHDIELRARCNPTRCFPQTRSKSRRTPAMVMIIQCAYAHMLSSSLVCRSRCVSRSHDERGQAVTEYVLLLLGAERLAPAAGTA